MVIGRMTKANSLPTSVGAPIRPPSANAQAASTTNAGLTNSDGCTPAIQRREPLTSAPNISASTTNVIATMKTINAVRRTPRG